MSDPTRYGALFADRYDEMYGPPPEAAILRLSEWAGPAGRALELGIGTGRVALPLQARGVPVHGIDVSPEMVARLRAKPGGDRLHVTLGDFSSLEAVPGAPFQLVFCVFSTLFALTSQEAQVRCFRAVASVLAPGGTFALEMFVPDPARYSLRQPALVRSVEEDGLTLEGSEHDALLQRVHSRVVAIRPDAVTVLPIDLRYAWPAELDLMAQLAGLGLKERWADWERRPPAAGDPMQVSVYRKPIFGE